MGMRNTFVAMCAVAVAFPAAVPRPPRVAVMIVGQIRLSSEVHLCTFIHALAAVNATAFVATYQEQAHLAVALAERADHVVVVPSAHFDRGAERFLKPWARQWLFLAVALRCWDLKNFDIVLKLRTDLVPTTLLLDKMTLSSMHARLMGHSNLVLANSDFAFAASPRTFRHIYGTFYTVACSTYWVWRGRPLYDIDETKCRSLAEPKQWAAFFAARESAPACFNISYHHAFPRLNCGCKVNGPEVCPWMFALPPPNAFPSEGAHGFHVVSSGATCEHLTRRNNIDLHRNRKGWRYNWGDHMSCCSAGGSDPCLLWRATVAAEARKVMARSIHDDPGPPSTHATLNCNDSVAQAVDLQDDGTSLSAGCVTPSFPIGRITTMPLALLKLSSCDETAGC
mmetsp:Transcript_22332/g.57406  ORF Transcript_22332/g.57406 Transcript_22332/m.57406 type:complete len:396 (-) Transcript_22332:191-1378(-)